MAARLSRSHSETVRQKIQASVIIDRLQKHSAGEIEMTPTQIKASEILLDRSVAKLQQIQHIGDEEKPIQVNHAFDPAAVQAVNGLVAAIAGARASKIDPEANSD